MRIEEQLQGINGIKKITSKSSEGSGNVTIELLERADIRTVLDEVKARLDAIETFPEEIESPIIQEVLVRREVIHSAVVPAIVGLSPLLPLHSGRTGPFRGRLSHQYGALQPLDRFSR